MKFLRFLRDWTLPVSMVSGVILYLVYVNVPFLAVTKPFVERAIGIIQPTLIFLMLFLTFCKVEIHDLKPCRWHAKLLLIQGGAFIILAAPLLMFSHMSGSILLEGAMLCMICPTATAAAVITHKLGGDAARLTSYTILVNLLVAVLVPVVVPVVHPQPGLSFNNSVLLILGKVFPLLLCPFILAVILRYLVPKIHARIGQFHELAFYLWAVALTLAIAMTVRTIVHSSYSIWYQFGLALISLISCALQFYLGKKIGRKYGDSISAGQALGQKNTVLAIWMGYTFFTPITAVAAGFYSVWHNVVNSYQLYQQRKSGNVKLSGMERLK